MFKSSIKDGESEKKLKFVSYFMIELAYKWYRPTQQK
ncbi:hypothetical protein Lser_V15G31769 [Lactuca serriola]